MTRELKPCGTLAAWFRHRRKGEEPCDACREANRAYYTEYNRTYTRTSQARDRAATQTAAYNRATKRLKEAHADEFRALYAEELDR